MTSSFVPTPVEPIADPVADDSGSPIAGAEGSAIYPLPEDYSDIRSDPETQFAQLELKPPEPKEPSWFSEMLQAFFDWLGGVFGPVGGALASNWSIIQWGLFALLGALVLYLVLRLVGPLAKRAATAEQPEVAEPEWTPVRAESLALLEDADRLANDGRYDEAARLLLQRSVGQISQAHPDWVEPSSTARELAALPKLSETARRAFGVMSAAVESSLFALRSLSKEDWKRARQAYADFALAKIDAPTSDDAEATS
ncbi:MAG: hypothetical protein AAFQ34_13945 [Pseudomonadota bacterium]